MAFKSIEAIEIDIGEKIRRARLDRNKTQAELATRAGITMRALGRLETGAGSTMKTLIAVTKALQLEDWFDLLAPVSSVNPFDVIDNNPRQRARRKKDAHGNP